MLRDRKVLVIGGTGQIGRPIVERLATDNEVWCATRFADGVSQRELHRIGVRTVLWDLSIDDVGVLPEDFTHVLHAARVRASTPSVTLELNVERTAALMTHCRRAAAFVYVSSCSVYERQRANHAYREEDPLTGTAVYGPGQPLVKVATEAAVRACAVGLGLPSTIARMSAAYGRYGHGGLPTWFLARMEAGDPIPVPAVEDSWVSLIHEDDVAEHGSGPLFDIAAVPATIVNWGGDEAITTRTCCDYLGEMKGLTPDYARADPRECPDTFVTDNTRRRALIGSCGVSWPDGLRAIIEKRSAHRTLTDRDIQTWPRRTGTIEATCKRLGGDVTGAFGY